MKVLEGYPSGVAFSQNPNPVVKFGMRDEVIQSRHSGSGIYRRDVRAILLLLTLCVVAQLTGCTAYNDKEDTDKIWWWEIFKPRPN